MYRRLLSLTALTAALCSFSALAADQPPAAPTLDTLAQVVAFAKAHAWGPLAAIVIGAIVWASKTDLAGRITGKLPAKFRPLVALVLGVLSGVLDVVTHGGGWVVAISAGLMSSNAAQIGHVLFVEILRGGRELGQPKPAGASPATSVAGMVLLALMWCSPIGPLGCAALLPAIAALAQGASFLSGSVDAADAGQQKWFAHNPNQDAQAEVAAALTRARDSAAVLEALGRTAKAADGGDIAAAKAEAVLAYAALHKLLDELGVLAGTPSVGGAETDAPQPGPLVLPRPDEVAAKLGAG